jgi:Transposase DDE domain
MAEHRSRWISEQVRNVVQRVRGQGSLPFQDVLSSKRMADVIRETGTGWRHCSWTPEVTVWTFLTQVLSADHSCRDAVVKLRTHQVSDGKIPVSPETGPYCKARQRLPEELPFELARRVGAELDRCVPRPKDFLGGRALRLIDGTTFSMPDTAANQQAYPQPSTQAPGVGFPLARLVALLSWHSGAVREIALAPYAGKETGETALFRQMFECLSFGEIVIGDTYFGSWWTIAMLKARGVDSIFPLHQLRACDFRRGVRLGFEDHTVVWVKPARAAWMDPETYESLPDELTVRELKVHSDDPTTRVGEITLVTTLLDPDLAPKHQISQAYHWRWDAEPDLRSIKCSLQMDVLRCKTPEMVRKEIGMHLLAYNLIRTVIAESAAEYHVEPRSLSFKGALQALNAFRSTAVLAPAADLPLLYDDLLGIIASHPVRNRPGRVEPRAVKRRPKCLKLLTVPRSVARKLCPESS